MMNAKRMMKAMLLAVVLCMASGVVLAQSAVDGAIGGTVQDPTGLPVPNAKVVIHNNSTNAEQTELTDGSGFFRAIHLQPTTYTVSISASGFENYRSPEVIVQVGALRHVGEEEFEFEGIGADRFQGTRGAAFSGRENLS